MLPPPLRLTTLIYSLCRCGCLSLRAALTCLLGQVVCGPWWSMAVTVDGYVYAWGSADGGWTGLGRPKGLSVVDPGPSNDRQEGGSTSSSSSSSSSGSTTVAAAALVANAAAAATAATANAFVADVALRPLYPAMGFKPTLHGPDGTLSRA